MNRITLRFSNLTTLFIAALATTSFSCTQKESSKEVSSFQIEQKIRSIISTTPNWSKNELTIKNLAAVFDKELTPVIEKGIMEDLPMQFYAFEQYNEKGKTDIIAGISIFTDSLPQNSLARKLSVTIIGHLEQAAVDTLVQNVPYIIKGKFLKVKKGSTFSARRDNSANDQDSILIDFPIYEIDVTSVSRYQ